MSTAHDDAARLLELLGDRYAQSILAATDGTPKSAAELSSELEVARSTIYRRAEELVELGLLAERTRLVEGGSHHAVYEANLDRLAVELVDGGFEVDLRRRETPAERFAKLWDDIRGA